MQLFSNKLITIICPKHSHENVGFEKYSRIHEKMLFSQTLVLLLLLASATRLGDIPSPGKKT
jgi:hypothetical protein